MNEKIILLEERYILEYLRDILNDMKLKKDNVDNAKYHHNTSYENASSICKYGILSIQDLNRLKIRNYSEENLELMSDIESHINGIDNISLSIVGLKDIYPNEFEYDPFDPSLVDFLVTSDLKAGRSSYHYGNEFLTKSVEIDKLRSVDIRLLTIIQHLENSKLGSIESLSKTIEKYNKLREIALEMKKSNLDIPLREMAFSEQFNLDKDQLSTTPKLILK